MAEAAVTAPEVRPWRLLLGLLCLWLLVGLFAAYQCFEFIGFVTAWARVPIFGLEKIEWANIVMLCGAVGLVGIVLPIVIACRIWRRAFPPPTVD